MTEARDQVEFSLLVRSHGSERAKELLSQRYSIFGEQKPLLVLDDITKKSKSRIEAPAKKPSKKSETTGSLKELLASPPKYEDYLPLNQLWNNYIQQVLSKIPGEQPRPSAVAQAILTADWHGALVVVVSAHNPTLVGLEGLIIWEGQHVLLLVSARNRYLKIPKKGCILELHELPQRVLLVGDRLAVRSAERSTRKFKAHDVEGITPLMGSLL